MSQTGFDLARKKTELSDNQFGTVTRSLDRTGAHRRESADDGDDGRRLKVVVTDGTITSNTQGPTRSTAMSPSGASRTWMDAIFTETTNPFGVKVERPVGRKIAS